MLRLLRAWCVWPCLNSLIFSAMLGSQAAEQPSLESQVKAAFLLNFTKFAEWPTESFTDPSSPISICVAGEDPIEPVLEQMVAGETVGGRRVAVLRAPADPAKSCQLLFVSKTEKEVPKLLAGAGRNVLTVGESEGFLAQGGMINFVLETRRVRFDINQKAVVNSALKLSSKLFNVARQVEK